MTKVCHFSSAHSAEDTRIFFKECRSLAKAGYDVTFVVHGTDYIKDGVKISGIGPRKGGRLYRMLIASRKIYKKALSLDADIYHFHDPELLPYGYKLKKAGKKVIFDSHENYPEQIRLKPYLPGKSGSLLSKIYKQLETRYIKNLDAVIVPCTFDGVNIFEGRTARTCFLANYPPISIFYDNYDPEIKAGDCVCYVGGLSYERGIYHLTKACALAGKKLILAGPFSDDRFKKELFELPEAKCIEYLGCVPNDEVHKIIQKSFLGANTILDVGQYHHLDTFGVKVFEYMSMGVPVLLPDYPFMRKMSEKYGFGICVAPDNPEDISDKIKFLSDNPDIAVQMGMNGRKAVIEEFNWGAEEKKLLALYDEISRK